MSHKPPPSASPLPEPPVCARSTQRVIVILIAVSLLLIGWRWVGDRWGARPTELKRDAAAVTHHVDINRANRTELMQLPGIGPSRADKILAYRKTRGGFQRIEDLRGVDGIGDATMARIKPWLAVDDANVEEEASEEPERLVRKPATEPVKTSTKKPAPNGMVDLNTASPSDLQSLPGVGPTLAQRIVEQRKRTPFAKVEDLRRVNGIGAKRFEQIKPFVVVAD